MCSFITHLCLSQTQTHKHIVHWNRDGLHVQGAKSRTSHVAKAPSNIFKSSRNIFEKEIQISLEHVWEYISTDQIDSTVSFASILLKTTSILLSFSSSIPNHLQLQLKKTFDEEESHKLQDAQGDEPRNLSAFCIHSSFKFGRRGDVFFFASVSASVKIRTSHVWRACIQST